MFFLIFHILLYFLSYNWVAFHHCGPKTGWVYIITTVNSLEYSDTSESKLINIGRAIHIQRLCRRLTALWCYINFVLLLLFFWHGKTILLLLVLLLLTTTTTKNYYCPRESIASISLQLEKVKISFSLCGALNYYYYYYHHHHQS